MPINTMFRDPSGKVICTPLNNHLHLALFISFDGNLNLFKFYMNSC